jgi:hypothetical protein
MHSQHATRPKAIEGTPNSRCVPSKCEPSAPPDPAGQRARWGDEVHIDVYDVRDGDDDIIVAAVVQVARVERKHRRLKRGRDSYRNEKARFAEVARTTDHNLEVRDSDVKAFEPAQHV